MSQNVSASYKTDKALRSALIRYLVEQCPEGDARATYSRLWNRAPTPELVTTINDGFLSGTWPWAP